ncbi:MAG TPA: DUF192 domain-containing protein [Vicinamibacterales bacterium]|nr:DUF192 domain-containing protein [Vicinamibacterales bacterium]
MHLVNQRTGDAVATVVEIAATRATRRQGLLGRASLDASAAMVIAPCFAVHTMFMRFPIDAVFVDREGTVRKIVTLPAWRAAADVRASAVVEFAAGAARGLRVGDRLYLSDVSGSVVASFSGASLRSTASNPACSGS